MASGGEWAARTKARFLIQAVLCLTTAMASAACVSVPPEAVAASKSLTEFVERAEDLDSRTREAAREAVVASATQACEVMFAGKVKPLEENCRDLSAESRDLARELEVLWAALGQLRANGQVSEAQVKAILQSAGRLSEQEDADADEVLPLMRLLVDQRPKTVDGPTTSGDDLAALEVQRVNSRKAAALRERERARWKANVESIEGRAARLSAVLLGAASAGSSTSSGGADDFFAKGLRLARLNQDLVASAAGATAARRSLLLKSEALVPGLSGVMDGALGQVDAWKTRVVDKAMRDWSKLLSDGGD